MDIEVIHLIWRGPITVDEALKLNRKGGRGLYQIYGSHSITGPNTLLYVGQTNGGTFSKRICKHREEWLKWEPESVRIHVGRLAEAQPLVRDLRRLVLRAEMITIYYASPAYNVTYIKKFTEIEIPTLVVNHLHRGRLPGSFTNLGEIYIPGEKGFEEVDSIGLDAAIPDLQEDNPIGRK